MGDFNFKRIFGISIEEFIRNTEKEKCVFCDCIITDSKGRQLSGSFKFNNKWICGDCADQLFLIMKEFEYI